MPNILELTTTRRRFLGSLLVLPVLALAPNSIIAAAERVIVPDKALILDKAGILEDFTFWYRPNLEGGPYSEATGSLEIVRLPGGEILMTLGAHVKATYRWVAAPGQGIVVTEERPIMIYLEKVEGLTGYVWTNLGGDDTSQFKKLGSYP